MDSQPVLIQETPDVSDEAKRIAIQWGIPLGIAFVAAVVRVLATADKLTFAGLLRGVVIGLFVGMLVAMQLDTMSLAAGTKGAIVGVSAVLAEDLLLAIIRMGKYIREHPGDIIDFIIRRRR